MLEPMNIDYIKNTQFKSRTREETEEYNKYQLKGLELYKSCNIIVIL